MTSNLRAIALSIGIVAAACTPPTERPPLCAGLPVFENERADAVPVLIVVENRMGGSFNAIDACILVDGRALSPNDVTPLIVGFAAHRPLEFRLSVRRGVAHEVTVLVSLRGTHGLEGYRFDVSSKHTWPRERLSAGRLVAQLEENGGPSTPLEQRPTVEWVEPPAS